MSDQGSFAYGASAVVTSDGRDLLVYDPSDEAPRWMKTLHANVAHVAVAGDRVIAVDTDGHLTTYDAAEAEEKSTIDLGGTPHALTVNDDAIAVALAGEILVVRGEDKRTIALPGARALAFD